MAQAILSVIDEVADEMTKNVHLGTEQTMDDRLNKYIKSKVKKITKSSVKSITLAMGSSQKKDFLNHESKSFKKKSFTMK
jgi:hypothetical protein